MADDKTVVLRVQLDEGATEQQLKKLVLDLEATRTAQKALTAERKAGTKSDEEFAAETVKLQQQLKGQQGEYASLTKNLNLYRQAQNGEANSYQATQAALSLAIRQQQQLADSADNSGEASKALTAQIEQYRATLAATDAQQGAFFRQIGNYPKGSEGLEQLVQQLVTLQEQQKRTAEGTKEAETVTRQIGFVQTAAAQAGAQAGLSYEQTTAKVAQYSEALRPAAAALVEVAQAEQQASASGEATGETMKVLGFQTAAARKSLNDATEALGKTNDTTEQTASTTDKAADFLGKLGNTAGKLPGPLGQAAGGLAATGQGLLTATKAALAFIATPLGLVLAAIAAAFYVVKEALTSTDEGQEDLAAGSAALGAVLNVLKGIVITAGKFIVKLFTDPKEAAKDLLEFIESQVINRVKALGIIFDALKNGDFKQAANGVLQYATGVEDVIGKTQRLTEETRRAAAAAYDISRAKDGLEDLEIDAIARGETQRQQAERLVATAKDRNLTEKQRLANLDEASRLERAVLNENLKIERERLRIIQAENAESKLRGTLQDDQRRTEAEQLAKLARLQGEYDKEEQQRENRRSILQSGEAEKRKAEAARQKQEAEKREELRLKALREGYALENQLLDGQLRDVQKGSDKELSLLQQKLRIGYQTELAQKDLTAKGKLLIDRKYESDSLALTLDFQRRKLLAALQAQSDNTAAQIAGQQADSGELLRLQTEQLENQRLATIAALDKNNDNTAAINRINAQAEQQRRQLEYADAMRLLQEHLDQKRQLVKLAHAQGQTDEQTYQTQLAAIDKAGTDAQAVVNADYRQSNTANNKAAGEQDVAEAQRVSNAKVAIQDATLQAATQFTDLIIENTERESAANEAAIFLKKSIALIEIGINLQKALSANAAYAATLGPFGVAYLVVTDALAIIGAATATANVLKLQRGGIADGPSHAEGGIPLYRRGRPAGIEIEGGEPVLTAAVSRSPHLLAAASAINVAAGGRPLVPGGLHLALGAITRPVALAQMRGDSDLANHFRALGKQIEGIKIYTRTSDTKAVLGRDAQTVGYTNN